MEVKLNMNKSKNLMLDSQFLNKIVQNLKIETSDKVSF